MQHVQELEYEVEHELNWGMYEDWIIDSPNQTIMTDRFIETYMDMNEIEFKSFINHIVNKNSPF
jgi:hypothetical protein